MQYISNYNMNMNEINLKHKQHKIFRAFFAEWGLCWD